MQSWKSTAVALLLAALLATTVQTPASADGPSMSQAPDRVGVMTLNMYIGADLGPLRAVENPEDLPGVVAEVWEQFGIMWNRLGTPTGDAASGTVEEFDRAYRRWLTHKQPKL